MLPWLLLITCLYFTTLQDKYQALRNDMVDNQIEARGITNSHVLKAMRKVPRQEFVPDEYKDMAYYDGALPIGYKQTISQPYIVGYMTNMLNPQKEFKVLEIGTGSGYQAAILAEIVREVYTIEIIPELGEQAKERFRKMGYDNIVARIGDGYQGWEEEAPFDAIIVTAAAVTIPDPLVEQLKEGGRMAIPVGPQSGAQYLMLIRKSKGKIKKQTVMPVRFVPFTHPVKDKN